jgi:hypothetical protein
VVGNSRPELAASRCKRLGGAGSSKSVVGVDMLLLGAVVGSILRVAVG